MNRVVGRPIKSGQVLNPEGRNGYTTGYSQLKQRARYLHTSMTVSELKKIMKSPAKFDQLSIPDAILMRLMWEAIYGKNHIRASETLLNLTDGKPGKYMFYDEEAAVSSDDHLINFYTKRLEDCRALAEQVSTTDF